MKRNAFGQLIPVSPYIRFADNGGDGGGGGDNGTGKEFTPPASQEELDRIVTDRVSRAERRAREDERSKFADYDAYKADAEKYRAANAPKPKDKTEATPSGVSEDDVDKRINEALANERMELALERVNDRLDKALEGRSYSASALFGLDRKQFVKEDGKTVDADAIKTWVEANSKPIEAPKGRRHIPGQGERDSGASAGNVQAGRDLYDSEKKKPRKD